MNEHTRSLASLPVMLLLLLMVHRDALMRSAPGFCSSSMLSAET